MHFRWLQLALLAAVICLNCLIVPAAAALKEMDAAAMDAHYRQHPAPDTLFLLCDKSEASVEAEAAIEKMIEEGGIERYIPGIKVVKEIKGGPMSSNHKVTKYPSIILVRDDITAYYTDDIVREDLELVYYWLHNAGPKKVTKELNDDTFEHLTQAATGSTTGYWLVYFYYLRCQDHMAIIESMAVEQKNWLNVAAVDLAVSPKTEKRFRITKCPELYYFKGGKMYPYELRKWDVPSIKSFIENGYKHVKASDVPPEKTSFDSLTETIALFLKEQLEGENRMMTLVAIGGLAVTIVLAAVFCCLTGGSDSKRKKD